MNFFFEDFTEQSYRDLIQQAKRNYTLITYPDCKKPGSCLLLRHDIDFSVHRAYSIAKIEAEEGVLSTYFLHLHSEFYNLLEYGITDLILKIKDLGHQIGLHFDPHYKYQYSNYYGEIEEQLQFEKIILENIFNTEIMVFSLHNPDNNILRMFPDFEVANMINTYASFFLDNYAYCSDSNGYWRYDRLYDVLNKAEHDKLQILTHPEWWTPEPMSPRARVSRCIEGRATRQHQRYDELLERMGRLNVR